MKRDTHTDWCVGGHQCGLGEHRSEPLVISLGAFGRIVATRILDVDGGERMELRLALRLDPGDPSRHAAHLLGQLARLVQRTAVRARWSTPRNAA